MLIRIKITLKSGIMDPQGKAVLNAMSSLGFDGVSDVRVGKYIELKLNSDDREKADREIRKMCEKLLVNPVIENYSYTVDD